jgi:hypothetical protein
VWKPFPDYVQQGSFIEPIPTIAALPSDSPLYCVKFNQDWQPAIVGALMQLIQPNSFATSDPVERLLMLEASTDLIALFGNATDCPMIEMRVSGCELQFSVDSGATWTTVTNWDAALASCFPGSLNPAPPSNPQGATTHQQACNIAGYIANGIIKASLNKAITDINNTKTLFEFGVAITALIPGLDLAIPEFIGAIGILYLALESGTLSDYTAAVADVTLWSELTCAIYQATKAVGHVDASNYAAVVSAVGSISYVHADVISTIHDYVANLGLVGLQTLQNVGVLSVSDCSACDVWCVTFDFTVSATTAWVQYASNAMTWVTGQGWTNASTGEGAWIHVLPAPFNCLTVEIFASMSGSASNGPDSFPYRRLYSLHAGGSTYVTHQLPATAGAIDTTQAVDDLVSELIIGMDSDSNPLHAETISKVIVRGFGSIPWSASPGVTVNPTCS